MKKTDKSHAVIAIQVIIVLLDCSKEELLRQQSK